MKIIINESVVEIIEDRNIEVITNKLHDLFDQIYNKQLIISQVLINEIDVTEDVFGYLSSNISNVESITILTETREAVFENLLIELNDYIPRVLTGLEKTSDHFYGELNPSVWSQFSELTSAFQWIMKAVEVISYHLKQYPDAQLNEAVKTYASGIMENLAEIEQCIENKDYVAVADILKMEISDLLQELLNAVKSKVST